MPKIKNRECEHRYGADGKGTKCTRTAVWECDVSRVPRCKDHCYGGIHGNLSFQREGVGRSYREVFLSWDEHEKLRNHLIATMDGWMRVRIVKEGVGYE